MAWALMSLAVQSMRSSEKTLAMARIKAFVLFGRVADELDLLSVIYVPTFYTWGPIEVSTGGVGLSWVEGQLPNLINIKGLERLGGAQIRSLRP